MLFLRAIHPCYEGLLNQFASKQKDLSTASIHSVLSEAKYMDGFIPLGAKGKAILPPSTPCSPAAAMVVTNSDGKEHASVSSYPPSSLSPSCCRVSLEAFPPGPTCSVTQLVDAIVLPPILVKSLLKAIPSTSSGTSFRLVVADTGATDHMVPDHGAFISYKSVHGFRVLMGNNSFAPVLGRGTAIISLNGQRLLIRNVLHAPGLRAPLSSLQAHLCQSGCGFLGSYKTGMRVYFPGVVVTVDTSLTVICLTSHLGRLQRFHCCIMFSLGALPWSIPLSVQPFWLCLIFPGTLPCPRILPPFFLCCVVT